MIALHLLRESYLGLVSSTLIDVSPLQPEKALLSIDVTLLGMVSDVRPLQPEKAELTMNVTLLGMVTDVRPLQPENILSIDNQQLIH